MGQTIEERIQQTREGKQTEKIHPEGNPRQLKHIYFVYKENRTNPVQCISYLIPRHGFFPGNINFFKFIEHLLKVNLV